MEENFSNALDLPQIGLTLLATRHSSGNSLDLGWGIFTNLVTIERIRYETDLSLWKDA